MAGRKKGVKAAPYDPSSSSISSFFQSMPLPPLPEFLNGLTDSMSNGKQSKSKDRSGKKGYKGSNGSDDIVQTMMALLGALMSWYSSLQPQNQRYTAWAFLGFLTIFTSGFWTLKLAFAGTLLLLRPVSVHQNDARKGKSKRRQKDADGQPFSTDAMVAALQRIPETFTYGNVTPSKSSPMQTISTESTLPTAGAPPPSQAPSLPPSSPPSLPPSLHSSTTDPYNVGPLPNPHNPTPMSSVEWGDSSSDSISSTAPWQRKPSGNFHRIEVAKKFVNRKFGGGSKSREETPPGASADEEERQLELLRDCTPILEDEPSMR